MDDPATWLASELDRQPAACQAAIEAKTRGRKIDNLLAYIKAIPVDDWLPLVEQHKPQTTVVTLNDEDGNTHEVPARQGLAQGPCRHASTPGHSRHLWTDRRGQNRMYCQP